MSDRQFCLQWKDYSPHVQSMFEKLREEHDLIDITISCDGFKLPAHKVILSACSPLFRSLIKDNPCEHPIIVLQAIQYSDMSSLLDFMYSGSVNVADHQLQSFLQAAEALQIQGLADSHTRGKQPNRKVRAETKPESPPTSPIPPAKKFRKDTELQEVESKTARLVEVQVGGSNKIVTVEDATMVYATEEADPDTAVDAEMSQTSSVPYFDTVYGSTQGLSYQDTPHYCDYCAKKFLSYSALCHHRKLHTGDTVCPVCNKTYSTLFNMRIHMRTVHRIRGEGKDKLADVTCPICKKEFSSKHTMKGHLYSVHSYVTSTPSIEEMKHVEH